ncbi:MAG: hypothetical protein JNM89_01295 [Hyphomicrobiaceae bacterium]|nr:hypothetical protein [Hyphomicrobiaceae bacterium]
MNQLPKATNKALNLIDAVEKLADRCPQDGMVLDDYRTEVTTKLAALMTQLPKDLGATEGGHDRFELEHMVETAASLPSNAELRAALEDIVGTIDCLVFLPKSKVLH